MSTETVTATGSHSTHDAQACDTRDHDNTVIHSTWEKPIPLPNQHYYSLFSWYSLQNLLRLWSSIHSSINSLETGIANGMTGYDASIIMRWSLKSCTHRIITYIISFFYQTALDADLSYFWVHLAWQFQCLFSVLRLHFYPLFFRDVFRVCSTAISVCKSACVFYFFA